MNWARIRSLSTYDRHAAWIEVRQRRHVVAGSLAGGATAGVVMSYHRRGGRCEGSRWGVHSLVTQSRAGYGWLSWRIGPTPTFLWHWIAIYGLWRLLYMTWELGGNVKCDATRASKLMRDDGLPTTMLWEGWRSKTMKGDALCIDTRHIIKVTHQLKKDNHRYVCHKKTDASW